MNKFLIPIIRSLVVAGLICASAQMVSAQTDMDGIMLKRNVLCVGAMYSHSSWTNYWEGTFKRDNDNIGKVSMDMYGLMGNYGITDKLNLLFSVPYVTTKATKGTLTGLDGVQDLSLMLKWMGFEKKFDSRNRLSVYGIGRISFPLTNYVADFQPLSIGMRSKTAGLRALVDYQHGKLFATGSANYTYRMNIDIDRTSYYTTEMHYTTEVKMPNMWGYNVRLGYRTRSWVAEGVLERNASLGGFDIRKNDMPFPSNEMNMTQLGPNFKYSFSRPRGLELTAGARYVFSGRNVGQSTTFNGGAFYLMNLKSKRKIQTNITN